MMDIKLGVADTAAWDALYKTRDRMNAFIVRIALHFLSGAAIAAYLAPEGMQVVAACMVVVIGMKALYDYFDKGAVGLGNAAALAAGSGLVLGIAALV